MCAFEMNVGYTDDDLVEQKAFQENDDRLHDHS
jgi:hypothetical protein